jgi:hypothetical protein
MRPTAQTMRDREMESNLTWARRDPPATDVTSGKALNELLRSIRTPGKAALNRVPAVKLDDDSVNLKNINVTDEASRGNVGLLKEKELNWPQPLLDERFNEARKDFNKKLPSAITQIKDRDRVDQSALKDLQGDLKALSDTLTASVTELSPEQYITARRYLNHLRDAVRALEDPNAANYFNNTWAAKGGTVAELVDNMKGLKFAPATPGKEKDYSALYQALRQFDYGLQMASSSGK